MTAADPGGWDTTRLDTPLVVTVPADLGPHPPALVAVAALAVEHHTHHNVAHQTPPDGRHPADGDDHDHGPGPLARWLGTAGVVAVLTPTTTWELHETAHGWHLVPATDPVRPHDLADAARTRAARLAAARTRRAPP